MTNDDTTNMKSKQKSSNKRSLCTTYTKEELATIQDSKISITKAICIWILIQKMTICTQVVIIAKKNGRSEDESMSESYPDTEEENRRFAKA